MGNFMNKRKVGLIAGVLCLLAVAGAFAVKMQYESKIRGDIEKALASLPQPLSATAGKIDVSFFNKSVTIANLKATYTMKIGKGDATQTLPIEYTVDRIEAAGINIDGFKEGAGAAKLLDSLVLVNTRFTSPQAQSFLARNEARDISGDASQLIAGIAKALPAILEIGASPDFGLSETEQKEFIAAFSGILKAYETVIIGESSIEGYQSTTDFDGTKVEIRMASGQAGKSTIRNMGPVTLKHLTAAVDGVQWVTLETISMGEIVLPSFVGFLDILSKGDIPDPQLLKGMFKDQTFALKNLRLKNLEARHPMLGDTPIFTLGEVDFSYVAETDHTVDFTFNDLGVPKAVIINGTGLPGAALANLPDTITFEGVIQQVAIPRETGAYDAECKKMFLKGSGLGEASLSFSIANLNALAFLMRMPQPQVKNFDLSLTDAGFSEAAFAVSGLFEGKTSELARAAEVASLRKTLEEDPETPGKEVIAGLADFLEKPGKSLRITMTPASPLSLEELEALALTDPAALGLTVTVTPDN